MTDFDLLIKMIEIAIKNGDFHALLKKLITDKIVEPTNSQLNLQTILYICEKNNFISEVGENIDDTIVLQDFLKQEKISSNISFNEFCNNIGRKQILFTNFEHNKTVIFYKIANFDEE